MDGPDPDRWSAVAVGWAELWGSFPRPLWDLVVRTTGIGPDSSVLDVGCGSGDLLAHLDRFGARTAGLDPADDMVALARRRVPAADVHQGGADHLPWGDDVFDVVTAVNALHFADDPLAALAEVVRVTRRGGLVVLANWAEPELNDLDAIETALAADAGDEPSPRLPMREPGGLERFLADGGLTVVDAGVVTLPWEVPDEDTLVRGVLLGEDPATTAAAAGTVLRAAREFRTATGGYRLVNAFRYAVGRVPGGRERGSR